VLLREGYTLGDNLLRLWEKGKAEPALVYGKPLEERGPGESVPLAGIFNCHFTKGDRGLLFVTALFDDGFGLGYLGLDGKQAIRPVRVGEPRHTGYGELYKLDHLKDDRFVIQYNIDGCSWGYEGTFDEARLEMKLKQVLWGQGELSQGVLEADHYDQHSDSYSLAFSTATSPAQIYTLDGPNRDRLAAHTRERVLGIPQQWMARGEDASYESHDGLQVSARLYLPAEPLGYKGPRPLVCYVHGGPQSQERPDFTWFSMPLIQYLTLKGFGVFVPNVRGSTGYGLAYTKHVDRDWGGKDRLDFVHGLKLLAEDPRLDTRRAGVVGRSYGGYMSLMLAGRHPELWGAAVDMFGPYDLVTFSERIPPTWKPYYKLAIGDPDDPADREELVERSPRTHLHQLACPLLVIQGANDPRVVVQESRDLVEALKAQGKQVELLVFEDEGHDVLKFDNRVRCYNAITDFFEQHLKP
jgi:dipeptidyl aminopeptidase/acylaminoacyl peptidase